MWYELRVHILATSLVEEILLTFKDKNHYCLAISDCEYRERVELRIYIIDKQNKKWKGYVTA